MPKGKFFSGASKKTASKLLTTRAMVSNPSLVASTGVVGITGQKSASTGATAFILEPFEDIVILRTRTRTSASPANKLPIDHMSNRTVSGGFGNFTLTHAWEDITDFRTLLEHGYRLVNTDIVLGNRRPDASGFWETAAGWLETQFFGQTEHYRRFYFHRYQARIQVRRGPLGGPQPLIHTQAGAVNYAYLCGDRCISRNPMGLFNALGFDTDNITLSGGSYHFHGLSAGLRFAVNQVTHERRPLEHVRVADVYNELSRIIRLGVKVGNVVHVTLDWSHVDDEGKPCRTALFRVYEEERVESTPTPQISIPPAEQGRLSDGRVYALAAHTGRGENSGRLTLAQQEANARYIFDYLHFEHGWSIQAISAVLGNMEKESAMNPGAWQSFNNAGLAYGIMQWDPARGKILREFGGTGNSDSDSVAIANVNRMAAENPRQLLDTQLDFLLYTMHLMQASDRSPSREWLVAPNNIDRHYNVMAPEVAPRVMTSREFVVSTYPVRDLTLVFHALYLRSGDYRHPTVPPEDRIQLRVTHALDWYGFLTRELSAR